jgi:hypothetical protein
MQPVSDVALLGVQLLEEFEGRCLLYHDLDLLLASFLLALLDDVQH